MNLCDHVRNAACDMGADPLVALQTALKFVRAVELDPTIEIHESTGPRKAWDGSPDLSGEGWLQLYWERHEYHESITWIRPRQWATGEQR